MHAAARGENMTAQQLKVDNADDLDDGLTDAPTNLHGNVHEFVGFLAQLYAREVSSSAPTSAGAPAGTTTPKPSPASKLAGKLSRYSGLTPAPAPPCGSVTTSTRAWPPSPHPTDRSPGAQTPPTNRSPRCR